MVKTFEFMFKIVLQRITMSEGSQEDSVELTKTSSYSVFNQKVARLLMSQAFDVLFGNVSRYLNVLKSLDGGTDKLSKEVEDRGNTEQSVDDKLIDDFFFIEASGG